MLGIAPAYSTMELPQRPLTRLYRMRHTRDSSMEYVWGTGLTL